MQAVEKEVIALAQVASLDSISWKRSCHEPSASNALEGGLQGEPKYLFVPSGLISCMFLLHKLDYMFW